QQHGSFPLAVNCNLTFTIKNNGFFHDNRTGIYTRFKLDRFTFRRLFNQQLE
ncbi:MAG: hypothetical protein GY757_49940, partial [bacterium]|nr:hypothetical protein [bacterium]